MASHLVADTERIGSCNSMQRLQSLLPYSAGEVSRCFTLNQTLGGAVSSFQSRNNLFYFNNVIIYTGNLNRETSGDSENAFLHWGDVLDQQHAASARLAANECTASHLEADSRRRCGRNRMQLLQCLLALGADVLQHASLRFPLEVIVHHLVQGLVVIAVIHVALQACELPAMG